MNSLTGSEYGGLEMKGKLVRSASPKSDSAGVGFPRIYKATQLRRRDGIFIELDSDFFRSTNLMYCR